MSTVGAGKIRGIAARAERFVLDVIALGEHDPRRRIHPAFFIVMAATNRMREPFRRVPHRLSVGR